MHVIKLNGYNATTENGEKLELGTFDSYGEEQLQIVKAQNWENLSVIATFNPPNKKPVQVVVDSVTGVIKVPKEATANLYGVGTIVFVGLADGVQRISADVEYIVRKHSNANGTEPAEPTPSVVEQILTEAQNANTNSAEAKEIAQSVRTDADNGKFNGKDGAKGDKGDDGTTPQLKIGEDNLWQVSYDNGATWVSLGVKATGEAGKDGEDGKNGLTPHIGENGNWWVGDTDTGVSAKGDKGDKGDTGAKGADGVSPTASVTQTDDGAEFTVTDASGTTTAMVRNGTDGKDAVVDATLTQDGQAADAKVTGEKISQLKEDTAALHKRQNVLVGSETGNPASCNDAFAAPLCGLTVYGKSTQDGTPTPDAPVPIVSAGDSGSVAVKVTGANVLEGTKPGVKSTVYGITYTVYENGILITGTATNDFTLLIHDDNKYRLTHGIYYLTTKGLSPSTMINFYFISKFSSDVQNQKVTLNRDVEFSLRLQISKGASLNATVQVSLTRDKITTYSPYREQLLTLPTPNGLPGIPVTSGGNYTDPQGQRWVCDEIDLERGVKVQRVDKTAFDSTKTLAEQNAILAIAIKTHLPPAEIAAYKALITYAPNTVVQASDDAGVKLKYQRDVNLVVKNLEDTIASMTTT